MAKVKPFKESENEFERRYDVRYILKPMTTTLQIFGLFIPKQRTGLARFLQWIWSILCLSILWFNTVRTAIIFQISNGLSESLTTTGATFIIFVAAAYECTVFLFVSTSKLGGVLDTFEEYRRQHGFAFNPKRVQRVLVFACVFLPVASFSSTALAVYILTSPETKLTRYLYPFESSINRYASMSILGLQIAFSGTLAALLIVPFGFFCYAITKEFSALNKLFSESASVLPKFEGLRIHHQTICRMLDQSNIIVTHIMFTILAAAIPVTCLLIFGISSGALPLWDTLLLLSLVLSFVFLAISLSIAAAILNLKAHGCLDGIMNLKLEGLPAETLHIISIFTTRLTGPPIGFHVYGMFTVDTSTILTIFGSLVTYAVVILQFNP